MRPHRDTSRALIRPADAVWLGALGLRTRKARTALSALGIAIAVAALVAVLGIGSSSKAQLLAQLGAEGNLLTVAAGQTFDGDPQPLPLSAEPMIGRIPPVEAVSAVGSVPGATVRRNDAVPPIETGGISVVAAQLTLPRTLSMRLVDGHFLDAVSSRYPETVLGSQAAANLGINTSGPAVQVYLGGRYVTVVGILAPVDVAPELDDASLVTFPVARSLLAVPPNATRIYLRVDPDQANAVAAVLPFTASPAQPEAVEVRRPSDILLARIATKTAFVTLLLELGAVALVVGGVGIANIMVISVLERRGEIGLRRALGARPRHIAGQFFLETMLISTLGGLGGILLGIAGTAAAARSAGEPLTIPAEALVGGLAAAVSVGILAGLYPALRAARLSPIEALRGF